MEIEGPLTIAIQDDEAYQKRELHIQFKPDFKQMDLSARVTALQKYINDIKQQLETLDADTPDRQGMETVMHIGETLLEYIAADQIDLEETIIIEIQTTIDVSSFIHGGSSIN